MDNQILEQKDNSQKSGRRSILRILGIMLILIAVMVALYLAVGYFAWQSGETLRAQQEEETRLQQYNRQVNLAQEDIERGGYNLALRRLDWVLEKDPKNQEAAALHRQAEAAIKTAQTPEAPPTPTKPPEPTVVLNENSDLENELVRLRRLYDREQWDELLPAILTMQEQFPNFERMETDRFLYDSYLNLGLQLLQGSQIERGLSYLAQAEKLGDLPQEALDYRFWAELYLDGISYYGVNWAVSSSVFRDLCISAPFYQNACDKLYESLINYGDQYFFSQDFCPAVELFREARQYGNGRELNQKLSDATEGCASATPTPAVITGTLSVTNPEPFP
jgi:tetratricopeptide (TPR) repeat protein